MVSVRDHRRVRFWALMGALLGAAVFLILYGVRVLDPTNADWMLAAGADPSQHYLGWVQYRHSEWHLPYLGMGKEENPFLGHRAIRYCLDNPDLYKVQLRALLRAGAQEKNIKIMLPLVTSLEEIQGARALLETCKAELEAEGLPCHRDIPLGIMVETPAAALIADLLARACDFFSIGTNDLTQYTMAVDRGNAQVGSLYTTFHPAVLRSIRGVITAAKEAGIPVGMCGEAAADPRLIPLLMTWGLDEFSVSSSAVLATRAQIHRWHADQAAQVAREAMGLSTAAGVEGYLRSAVKE